MPWIFAVVDDVKQHFNMALKWLEDVGISRDLANQSSMSGSIIALRSICICQNCDVNVNYRYSAHQPNCNKMKTQRKTIVE